jgi:hypothetical protein
MMSFKLELSHHPNVIYFCEILVHAKKIKHILVHLGFDVAFVVDECQSLLGPLA